MIDDNPEFAADVDTEVEEGAEPDFDTLAGIVADGLIGAVGGLVGTAALTVGLFVAATIGAFEFQSFAEIAQIVGLDLVFPANAAAVGFLLFLAGGMITWPLLFAATGAYLPGETYALKGLPYGAVLWTGFVMAFYTGQSGLVLAAYVVLTFLAHLAYGFTLGAVFDYLGDRPDTLV
jgi:hypothetical protein